MKINPDCIRDILLYLENELHIEDKKFSSVELSKLEKDLLNYSKEDIFYSVYNLNQIHFIEGNIRDVNDIQLFFCDIRNITWEGHQFLNTIRPVSVWNATKQGAAKLGIMSIHALSTISMKIADKIITDPVVIGKIIDSIK